MSTAQLLLLLVVAVLANIALMTAVAFPALTGRIPRRADDDPEPTRPEPADIALEVAAGQAGQVATASESRAGLSIGTYDRVVRIVSYAFLAGTAALVWLGGLYPTTAPAIFALLALAALFVLIVHDLAPATLLGPGKFIVEGSAAVAFFTILIALTGGAESPFFFGYYLVVAGAALVVGGVTTFVLASSTSVLYLLSIVAQPGSDQLTLDQLARVGFNTIALWLLSYLGFVLASEQRRTRDAALRLSLFDPLTQLYNRNYFFAVLERELQRASRSGRGFCLLMLDMDDLKPINDTFGHHYGDRMLQAVADVVRGGIRSIDAPARYGGDEFVVLLPETESAGAVVVAEKLRQGVADLRLQAGDRDVRSTVSIGVVAYPEDGVSGDQLLMRADAAMYEGKRTGKSRVARGTATGRAAGTAARGTAVAAPPAPVARRGTGRQETQPQRPLVEETQAQLPIVAAAAAPPAGLAPDPSAPAPRAPDTPAAPQPADVPTKETHVRAPPPTELGTVPRSRTRAPMAVKQPPRAAGRAGEPPPADPPGKPARRFRIVNAEDDERVTRTMDRLLPEDARKPPLDAIPPRPRKSR